MIGINQQLSTAVMIRTEEDEFIKRNTDCVYFLASPLTCKKGSECEYRHSDIARVNPRDCYYWFNGNCLNPKCAFRHPPLDGLLGADESTPVGTTVTQAPVKQGVACIFFQKGFCLKGHFCPFVHGSPNVFNNKGVQPVPHNPVTDPSKIASACPEKPVQKSAQKPTEFSKQVSTGQPRNNNSGNSVVMEKKVALSPASVDPPPVMNGSPVNGSNDGVYQTNRYVSDNDGFNGKDFDEYSREPSPGFDVLVDTELGDSEYYASEERFDMGRSVDYDVDQDMYNEQRDFDHYNKVKEFSDFEKKRYSSPDQFDFDKSDLRYQISKQRRGNNVGGLRSVVSRENGHTDRRHDRRGDPGQLSSRLRGRIKIPGRSMSPGNANGFRSGNYKNERRDYITSRGKSQHTDHGQTLGKRKYPRVESQRSEVNGSFEGPKPLSEILKRKRGSVICYVNKEEVD